MAMRDFHSTGREPAVRDPQLKRRDQEGFPAIPLHENEEYMEPFAEAAGTVGDSWKVTVGSSIQGKDGSA